MGKRILEPGKAPEKPKRAAIYLRVSTVYQIDKDSLPMMRQELTAYCEYVLGIKDYVIFQDAGYSGKNTDRPDYQKMMRQIREGLFTHLVVWKIDRISRNLLDFTNMYSELKDLGVTFISKNEQFDTSSAIGEAMLKIILVFAELERNMTSERVTATMKNRAANGIWNGGRIHYGYRYDKEKHEFSIHPDENRIYNFILDTYEDTKSVVRTSRKLNDAGYRTREGNLWSPIVIWTILRNPWYKGVYRYNYYKVPGRKEIHDESEWIIVENHHPASIDADRFERIQLMLDNNARFRNTPGRKTMRKNVHIFSGLIWCGSCGAAYTASPGRLHASGYRPSKYGCPNVRKTKTCTAKFTSDTVLGEFLLNYILNILNAQRNFSQIDSPETLSRNLLRGSTFSDVLSIDHDGLATLYEMLEKYSGSDTVLLKRPKAKPKVDPELKRMMNEKRKQERALERLNHLYLYSENSLPEQEYLVQKQEIVDALQEVNEAIGMMSKESWIHSMSDEDFLRQASTFIITQKLSNRDYIYFEALAESTDPEILKNFFNSILDSVILQSGRVHTVVFRNGLSHTFTYKE